MFWNAVWGGTKVLFHWESALAAVIYFALFLAPIAAAGKLAEKRPGLGCATQLLVLPFTQVFATLVVTWMLSPIILGLSDDAAWSLPWRALTRDPGYVIKVVFGATIATLAAAFVPVLGQMPTFLSLVSTGFVIAAVAVALQRSVPELAGLSLDLVPGFWVTIGFVFFGALAFMLGTGVIALIAGFRASRDPESPIEASQPDPLAMASASLLGLVPGFMYGAWLGLQFRHYVTQS